MATEDMRGSSITLIGMPASGKSMVGVLLAKRLGYSFVDTDLVIQQKEKRLLREIIAREGLDGFLEIENRINADIRAERSVIAPGGSAVYGREAMEHFKSMGIIVYLKVSYEDLKKRVGDLGMRGVAVREGMTFYDLYKERVPYYEKYADITVDETGKSAGEVVEELERLLSDIAF